MISRVIAYSARNPFVVVIVTLLLSAAGVWAVRQTPLDAIPDLSDVQVILYTEWPGRSPTLIEDQVTYPIVTALLGAPRVQIVRGQSDFGYSYVYVIFQDGTDLYWARSRVLEYLSKLKQKLPEGVTPVIGPDATGVGWVYEYALVDTTGTHDLAQLRSFQDWTLRYQLQSLPGVAEVASVGGFEKQYQVSIDPVRLLAYNIPFTRIVERVRQSNLDVGGRSLELGGREYMIRGRGYLHSIADLEGIPLGLGEGGAPIRLKDVATISMGPQMRRGVVELDGQGEVVGGVVVMRYGENALAVIDRVKQRLEQVKPTLPEGVQIIPVYDRSDLIRRAVATLRQKLVEVSVVVSLISLIFLVHFRSALVTILSLPVALLLSFLAMYSLNLSSNIMSLGGITIAIGAMVDAGIVMIENAHKRLEAHSGANRRATIIAAAQEVGKPLFFSLLIITVSFLPIFALEAQEGRLFRPLAYTKTFSMAFASLLSITLIPLLMVWLIRGRIKPSENNPINRGLTRLYEPTLRWALRHPVVILALAVLSVGLAVPVFRHLGSEFMPPLNEGTILYMPTSLPGVSITEAGAILQKQDALLKQFPEVEHVFGKIGRADTATDSAPLSMTETTITLKPESHWRPGLTWDRLVSEMDRKVRFPGMPNIWWMPIQNRTEMLATGVRSAVGIKIFGPDIREIERIGREVEGLLPSVPGTRSAFFERLQGGYYIDFAINRDAAARYDLTVQDIQAIVESAIGGADVTTIVEGRERYTVNVRYARDRRDDLERLNRVYVPTAQGAQIPLAELADIRVTTGPPMIRDENGSLSGIVYVDVAGLDLGRYVEAAQRAISEKIRLDAGYRLGWAGSFEYLARAKARLAVIVPITLVIVFVLLYLNFESVPKALIVLLSVPFAAVGSVVLLAVLGYHLSVAVWVGVIALAGVAAETGVVMLLYLDQAYEHRLTEGRLQSRADLNAAVMEGAVQRLRPKVMTVCAVVFGLLPILWSQGTGADIMKRIAAPMVGGMVTSTLLTLVVIPVIYAGWRGRRLPVPCDVGTVSLEEEIM